LGKAFFINGLNAKTGGGRSILNNLLTLIRNRIFSDDYYVLTPLKGQYEKYTSESLKIVDIAPFLKVTSLSPFVYQFVLPKLISKLNVNAILNLGDLIINTKIPQLYLFDWPYAAYPESVVWKTMELKGYMQRKVKLWYFKKYINHKNLKVAAQTLAMKRKLESLYGLNSLEIVPNAVSLENIDGDENKNYNFSADKKKFLYLTYYYSHKNLEIFIPLAKKIKALELPYCLIVTIAATQHKKAKKFLNAIEENEVSDIIINVGPVEAQHVPSLYKQSDALLMPSLLESFSGTYVEAMHHKKPILTSNIDFATAVCGDAALYFDPLNVDSILIAMKEVFENDRLKNRKIKAGEDRLGNMPNWNQVLNKIESLLLNIAN
jgi:glycosyltransferase involved in cell wall biosynthesis